MRILQVIPSLDPATGGPPIVASRLAGALALLGHQVALAAYSYAGAEKRTTDFLKATPGGDLVERVALGNYAGLERFTARRAQAILHETLGHYDLCHIHSVWSPSVPAAARAARRTRTPYIITPHGMLDPWAMSQRSLKKRVALGLGYRRMLRGAAFLHMLNTDEAEGAKPLNLRVPERVIANGIFLDELQDMPPRDSFRDRHPNLRGKKVVLFLSRLHYKKGLDYLAEAFALVSRQMADAMLVVAGPNDGFEDIFLGLVRSLGIGDRVIMAGPLYGRDKLAALNDCDCFCLPSRQEGFSVAILEALACGKPVVISQECHFPEVAIENAGKVVPLKADAIADALCQILSDAEAAAAMGKNGAAMVQNHYTWPAIATQFVAEYECVLAHP